MRITLNSISIIVLTLCLSSCQAVWDIVVSPFVEYDMEEYDIQLPEYYPECDYFFYEIDSLLLKNFLYEEQYCTYRWRLKSNSPASPIQTIMFDDNGNCVGGYEFCYGNAKILNVYDEVPIFQKNIYNDTIFKIVKFDNYVDLFNVSNDEKNEMRQTIKNYDYNMVVVWSYYGGYYMKRHLRQVKEFIEKFNDDYKFWVIYLNI